MRLSRYRLARQCYRYYRWLNIHYEYPAIVAITVLALAAVLLWPRGASPPSPQSPKQLTVGAVGGAVQAPTNTPSGQVKATQTGWPGAKNTGVPANTKLGSSGSIVVTKPGTAIANMDITGTVEIKAANVTIKNCKIHGGEYGVRVDSGNVMIQDSELYDNNSFAIGYGNWTGVRLNIHDEHQDGMKWGNDTSLTDSYVHNFTPSAGAHADGGQAESGAANLVIRHNYIDPSNGGDLGNSAVFLKNDTGSDSNGPIVVENNLLGGGNYTFYAVAGNRGSQRGIMATNNRFLHDAQYGPTDIGIPIRLSGNVWDDTGKPVGSNG